MDNLLVNGSFEEPDTSRSSMGWLTYGPDSRPNHPAAVPAIPDWTTICGTIDMKSRYWQATDGRQSVDLVGDSPATLQQSCSTAPGQDFRDDTIG
jgi:hypothetical protein